MAKIFQIISIVVTLLTASLAFVTKGKIDDLKKSRDEFKGRNEASERMVVQVKTEAKKASDDLTTQKKLNDEQKTQLTKAEGDVAAAKTDADKAKAEAAEATSKLDSLNKEYVEYKEKHPEGAVAQAPATNPADQTTVQLADLKKELDEQKAMNEALKQREKETAEKLASYQRKISSYEAPGQRLTTTGRVLAVNPGWNFVVIDVGDKRGATVNTPLLVMRGGQPVARLRITSVERGSSIADVVPGSIARGQSVQPGDQIIFSGRTSATTVTPPAPEAGAASTPAAGANPAPAAVTAPLPQQ